MRILKNILFLFLLTQYTAISQTNNNFAYDENFDGNNVWPQATDEKRELKIYNGRYYFEHKRKDSNWQISTPPFNLNTTNDFEIETSIQKISGDDNSGISFLYDYKDERNYKELGFTSTGFFRVAEAVNGTYTNIKAWTKSDKVKTGNFGINTLKITKKGSTITFNINGSNVHNMTHKGFVGKKIALTIYNNQKISIDYIKAKQLTTNSISKLNKTILFEGYNNNSNQWATENNENVTLEIKNGDYILEHKREKGGWNSTIKKKINTEKDFKITAQIKKVSGVSNFGYGLTFGRLDTNNQNEFFITSSGSFMVRSFENGKETIVKNWTKSEHIKTTNGIYNYLMVEKIGGALKFYINSKLVYTSYSFKFYGDEVGYIAFSKLKLSIGYLSMFYINSDANPNPIITPTGNTIFSDDFSSNANTWSESKNEIVDFSFYDGKYYLEHKLNEKGYLTHIDKYFDSSKDFEIETSLQHVSGDTNAPYGILWGKKDTNYFQLLVTATGYYKVNRVINNTIEDIVKWEKSTSINLGVGKTNKIKIRKEGEYYKFYINNNYITKIDFEAFFGNEIGYGVYFKQKIAVDYLKINSIKSTVINPIVTNKTLTTPLHDSFNTNTNNWNLDNASDYSAAMTGGQLILHRKKKGGIFISKAIDINSNKDFIIETAISQKNNDDAGMYGITFGRQNSSNEFSFLLASNGSYKFRKFKNDVHEEMIPLSYTSAIKTGINQVNKIKIVKSGQLLRFYINDTYVNESPFQPFFGNKFGYTIYYDKQIAVDYLDIKYQTATYNNPPVVTITEPSVEQERGFKIVKAKNILVRGIATDSDGIYEITVNGVEANVADNGTFTANVPLKYGKNDLIVKATDLKQASSTKTFVIKRNSTNTDTDTDTDTEVEVVNNDEKLDIGFGKYYALIVGVSTYQDKTIADLRGEPLKDAQALADVLTSKYNFEKENVTVLKNPEDNQISREFTKLSRKIGENDNLLIFYAGHGNYDKVTEKGYWMPSNANMEFEENIILNSSIVTYIKAIRSKHTLLIADACFSGSILTRTRNYDKASNAVKAKYSLPSRKAITSGALETVPNESVFMEFLIKKLKENNKPYLSAGQLFNLIEDPIIDNPRGDKFQRPIYAPISRTGNEGGDFIFIKRN